ncbi:MAG: dethiobiotin synthase [Casimicrobiaceae bacterium]
MEGRAAAHRGRAIDRDVRTMTRGIFVTGTDTGVGKTFVAVALLRELVKAGVRAVGMKPVAAGVAPGATINGDVEALLAAGNVDAPLSDVNPYSFPAAIAPHLAAARGGVTIDVERIASAYGRLGMTADVIVVEGAGGVLVPLGERIDMLDIARRLDLPVLLIVGVRLGCLNHALLSAQAIAARGLALAGWIANRIDPSMVAADANVASLADRLAAPPAADIAWHRGDGHDARVAPDVLRTLGLKD